MKTAVCISGQCRTLDRTYQNIREYLLEPLGDWDLFMFLAGDENCQYAERLSPTVLQIDQDRWIDENGLVNGTNCRFKAGVQPYLQQLSALQRCHRLFADFAAQNRIAYDCVIRSRPDIFFMAPLTPVDHLDLGYLYLPDFHHFDGCNDRFAIGNPDHMAIYLNKFDCFFEYVHEYYQRTGVPLSAEMFTVLQLQRHNIPMRTLPIRFNRMRSRGMRDDLKKTNRKIKRVAA